MRRPLDPSSDIVFALVCVLQSDFWHLALQYRTSLRRPQVVPVGGSQSLHCDSIAYLSPIILHLSTHVFILRI